MDNTSSSRRVAIVAGLLLVLGASGVAAYYIWFRPVRLPAAGSPQYLEYLRAFQIGVAALDTGRSEIAQPKLEYAVQLVPGEPAGWANLGLLHMRKNEKDAAANDLRRANEMAPESGEIEALLGQLARMQGNLPDAVAHFRKAVEKNPRDVMSIYTLAEVVSEEGGAGSETEYQRLMERILEEQPNNLHVLIKRAGAAYRRADQVGLLDALARFDRLAPGWTQQPQEKLRALHKAVDESSRDAELILTVLGNVLQGERGYSRDTGMLKPKAGMVGTAVQQFLRLQPPRPTPAPPDRELVFTVKPWAAEKPVRGLDKSRWELLQIMWRVSEDQRAALIPAAVRGGLDGPLAEAFKSAVFVANAGEVRRGDTEAPALIFPGGAKGIAPSAHGVLAIDWDNDLRQDLVLAGAGGLRFFHHQADNSFVDVSAKTGLSPEILGGDYYGAWAVDIETDGDLDIIVARRSGSPLLLRNNGDSTFKAIEVKEFGAVRDVRAFVWADLDNDGASDPIFLDGAGKLHVFSNERSGQFTSWPLPADLGTFIALNAADINDDGVLDIVALRRDGTIVRIADREHRKSWQTAEIAKVPPPSDVAGASVELFIEDMDNNGALDLIVAGPREAHLLLADEEFQFKVQPAAIPLHVFAALDLNGDGRLDLLGLSAAGEPMQALNGGTKKYNRQVFWPVANPNGKGDDRNNSFGIGGEVEVRSGLVVQKQRITTPMVHFGLGEQPDVNVAKILWPNGSPQWEFELPASLKWLIAGQRINTSCPFLFTCDGSTMHFAGDFMWATPLGMYVNAQTISSFKQTTEWLKIGGEHLTPKDGYYDVRVHANLWETDFFDQLALIVVDHPANTEIHVDERFFLTPTPPQMFVTTPARPVASAWDHLGQDVTDIVSAIDGRYLDHAGRGRFQGITNDHWVEAKLGDDAPTEGPVYLVARGWTHPTDSSINVAIGQGQHDGPRPLVLEVPDGKGGWKVGRPALGFPAGKNKTMMIRLDGIDGPGVSRHFRLRTNMEIYWDFLGYARGLDNKLAKLERPAPQSAELRYRGMLEMTQKDASSPELPVYDNVIHGPQAWRDLTGWYTRYGDVRELVAKVDDRFVIANAGDEIAFRFAVPPAPPAGWKRDFIWECDGWTRDGNPNTRFGTTVLPLPAHGINGLDQPPGRLEDDPVYRRFPQDWLNYHTRYVTPDEFERGLRTFRRPPAQQK